MKKLSLLLLLCLALSSCGASKDLAKTLRFANNNNAVGVESIKFKELKRMKKGEACSWNFLFFIPMFGDGSIITAAENGDINNIQLIGETGFWYGGVVNKNCTVVYGDNFNDMSKFEKR
jgi:hypothetical protein